jgi:hypothetical protein
LIDLPYLTHPQDAKQAAKIGRVRQESYRFSRYIGFDYAKASGLN